MSFAVKVRCLLTLVAGVCAWLSWAHPVFSQTPYYAGKTITIVRGGGAGTRGVRIGAHSVGHSVYLTARLFALLLDFKEPRFVVGFNDPEMDVASQ